MTARPTLPQAALAASLLDALPQTQCTRCGYPDCAAYAQAIASGQAGINQCPPGGAEGVRRLAALTGLPVQPLNPEHGAEGPRHIAWVDENACIGCTLCAQACPVDCIIGGPKRMHTVIEPQCTGCELCVPACPVDCIHLANVSGTHTGWAAWSQPQAIAARQRHAFVSARRQQLAHQQAAGLQALSPRPAPPHASAAPASALPPAAAAPSGTPSAAPASPAAPGSAEAKRAAIAAALARARNARQNASKAP